MLKVTQPAVDDASGTAGYSRGEIILLDQQRVLARASALPRHSYAVDAPANHHHLKVLAFDRRSRICC